jgi:hypothetical protein
MIKNKHFSTLVLSAVVSIAILATPSYALFGNLAFIATSGGATLPGCVPP